MDFLGRGNWWDLPGKLGVEAGGGEEGMQRWKHERSGWSGRVGHRTFEYESKLCFFLMISLGDYGPQTTLWCLVFISTLRGRWMKYSQLRATSKGRNKGRGMKTEWTIQESKMINLTNMVGWEVCWGWEGNPDCEGSYIHTEMLGWDTSIKWVSKIWSLLRRRNKVNVKIKLKHKLIRVDFKEDFSVTQVGYSSL